MPSDCGRQKPSSQAFSQSIDACEGEEILEVEPRENKLQAALSDAIS